MTPGVYFKFGLEECGHKNNQVVTFYWGGACKGYACCSVLTHQGSTEKQLQNIVSLPTLSQTNEAFLSVKSKCLQLLFYSPPKQILHSGYLTPCLPEPNTKYTHQLAAISQRPEFIYSRQLEQLGCLWFSFVSCRSGCI